MDEYLAAPMVADPLTRYDCVPVVAGAQAILEFGLWVFVYGLMVYLPAYAFHDSWGPRQPRRWQYGAAVVLPVLFAIPVALLMGIVHPVRVHFAPMVAGS